MSVIDTSVPEQIPDKMKAAVLNRPFDIELKELDVPEINADEVLIKVMAVGVCGSDVHYYENGRIGRYIVEKPIILGHECAGVVVAAGREVSRFKRGDRVAIEPGVTCGRCEYCKKGRYNLCPKVQFLATPPVDGAFVQFIKHREDFLYPIPDSLSFEAAALNEPFSVGIHAARRVNLRPGSTVAIMGMGPVGLMAVYAAKCFGASRIIVSDFEANRLEAAKQLGATHAIHIKSQEPVREISELTRGKGVDVAFETAGHPTALQAALSSVKRGGKLGIIGLPAQDEIGVNVPFIADNEMDIYGVFRYANTYPEGIEFLSSNHVDVETLITHRYSLKETKQALEQARTNKSETLKAIVYPNV